MTDRATAPVAMGDVIFMTARSVANPGFSGLPLGQQLVDADASAAFVDCFGAEPGELAAPGIPTADAILVLAVEPEGTIIGVRLGVMSTDAVANHLPEMAPKLSKPKVFFIGGQNEPVVLGVGFLKDPMDAERAAQNEAGLFGKNHQFLIVQTGSTAPSVDEQIAATGSELQGLRLFHSFVTAEVDHVCAWADAGYLDIQQATYEDVFSDKPGETWRRIMARRAFPENLFATWAQNPERN